VRREIDLELRVGGPVSGVVLELVAERQVLLDVRRTQDGRWLGWEVADLELPASVTEAVSARFGELTSAAREVTNVLAVADTRVDHGLLTAVTDQAEPDVLAGLDQLRTEQLIEEATEGADIRAQPTLRRLRRVSFSPFAVPRDGEGDQLSS
jgi:hypothetical protein